MRHLLPWLMKPMVNDRLDPSHRLNTPHRKFCPHALFTGTEETFRFDPNIAMLNGMRFPPAMMGPLPITPGEDFEMDEHGQVNWRAAWLKEIGHLQQVTTEQEKAGADQEWYRMMLYRVRTALMMPIMNPADASMIQHMVPQPAPVDGQPQQPQ